MFSFTPQPLRPNTRAGPLSSKPGSAPHVLKDRSGTSLHRKDHMRRVRLSGCKIAAAFGEQAQGVSTHDIIDLDVERCSWLADTEHRPHVFTVSRGILKVK
jgi:hypothetical protein